MKSGNVIETGIEGKPVKESSWKRGAKKRLSSADKATEKGGGDASFDIADQKYLSVTQVAKRWGVSESTVRRLIDEGELGGIRLRYACKISAASVEEYEKRAAF